jgi:hypothetical protein
MRELTITEIDEVNGGGWILPALKYGGRVVSGWLGIPSMTAQGTYSAASQGAYNAGAAASSVNANPQSFTLTGGSTFGSPSGR